MEPMIQKNGFKKQNHPFLIQTFCALLGLIYRVWYCFLNPTQARDAYDYRNFMIQWDETNIIPMNSAYPPLSLYILRIPYRFFLYDLMKGGIMMNMLLGIMIIYMATQIAKEIFQKNICVLMVGLICATNTALISYSCQMLRENSYIFFLSATILCIIRYYKKINLLDVILLGITTVCTAFCRKEGIELIPIIYLIMLFFLLQKRIKIKTGVIHSIMYGVSLSLFFVLLSAALDVPIVYFKGYLIK